MAGLIVVGIAHLSLKAFDSIENRRSPVLAAPPSPEGSSPHTTLRRIKRAAKAWRHREEVLANKVRALKVCRGLGNEACWAGYVSELRTIRRAREEAKFVRKKLDEAVKWCSQQEGIKKGSYFMVLKNPAERPMYDDTPPTLFDLPYPLPLPPPTSEYALSVERYAPLGEAPPAYSEEALDNEKTIERTEVQVLPVTEEGDRYD